MYTFVIISLRWSRGLIIDVNIMNFVTTLKDNVHLQLYFEILIVLTLLSSGFPLLLCMTIIWSALENHPCPDTLSVLIKEEQDGNYSPSGVITSSCLCTSGAQSLMHNKNQ